MCGKIKVRIECKEHGYSFSEAVYSDRAPTPLPCDKTEEFYLGWLLGMYDKSVKDKSAPK